MSKRMVPGLTGWAAAAAALSLLTLPLMPAYAGPTGYASAPGGVTTEGITHEEFLQWQSEMNRWLASETPNAVAASPVRVGMTPSEITALETAPRWESPMRIGAVKALAPIVSIDSVVRGRAPHAGAFRELPDGGLVWALQVKADGAGAVRLHVEGMSLPSGASLYVYSPMGQAFGPYVGEGPNGSGEFWTTTLFGSEAIVQLRVPSGMDDQDLRGLTFRITEAGLITANFASGLSPRPLPEAPPPKPPSFCGNAQCIVDATCFSSPADPSKTATAKMEWAQGAWLYTCTGGLISDNNPSQNNFFLTANHCVSKNATAQNVTFYWRFATSTCNGTCPDNAGWPYVTSGATVSATGRKGDFSLLHLNANPPAGSAILGWNSAPVANTNGAPLYRVSNPNFGPQVYSQHNVNTSAPVCSGWPRGERIYTRDQDVDPVTAGHQGAIDGGSSGSPILNASGQIVGQLSGTCGTNLNNVCDPASNATVDGAFAFYYATVQPILNP